MARFILEKADQLTIRQLETVMWSLSRELTDKRVTDVRQLGDDMNVLQAVIDRVRVKSPSMRARGLAFTAEALAEFHERGADTKAAFERLEISILAKLDDFIPHYLVKCLQSFTRAGYGSQELYDQLVTRTVRQLDQLRYGDHLRFFEIYT